MTEWLPNRMSVLLGPRTFGLPYRYGRLECEHYHERGYLRGTVTAGRRLVYAATIRPERDLSPCAADSLDEFVLERYTAYAGQARRLMRFRVWHEPWPQTPAEVTIEDDTLLSESGAWCAHARLVAANYSPGVKNVWIGRPAKCARGGRVAWPSAARPCHDLENASGPHSALRASRLQTGT
jgi:uncharacterized protein YqjF (DUF2071 family)